MKQPRRPDASPRKPRRRWRWHVPPAIVHGAEALEGTEILSEYSGELGLVLWQSVRDISLWSSITPQEGRAGLFGPSAGKRRAASLLAADPDSEIQGPLNTIARILEDPAGTPIEQVMIACREISLWAEAQDTLATALAFAQAAAFASPGNAAAGLRVGQLARRRSAFARAETWFRRTIGLARQSRDWTSYADAFLALGTLYKERGNLPVARQLYIRAYRAAKRHSLRHVQAAALHDLFVIAVLSEQHEDAESLARSAFEAYDPESPRIPVFAADVAYFWMTRGQFAPALSVYQALSPVISRWTTTDVLRLNGNIARAAGGAGDREAYAQARDRVRKIVRESEPREAMAESLLEVARGASMVGDWADAEDAARKAEQIANGRQEAQIELAAQSLLESVRSDRAVEVALRQDPPAAEVDSLASDLVRTLEEHTAVG